MYSLFFRARERPHIILDAHGAPAALATAVGNPAEHPGARGSNGNMGLTGADHTFTLIQPIANSHHSHQYAGSTGGATGWAEEKQDRSQRGDGGGYGGRGFHANEVGAP